MQTRVRESKLDKVLHIIPNLLDEKPQRVFNTPQIFDLVARAADRLGVSHLPNSPEILHAIVNQKVLRRIVLKSPIHREVQRYTREGFSEFELALSLENGAYLTHASAIFLHGLTDQIPAMIYVNKEQRPKPPGRHLSQEAIDRAFASPQRRTQNFFRTHNVRVTLLAGKYTARAGVETIRGPRGEELPVTCLERTLIDIAVRPAYSGGIFHVLAAYRSAVRRVRVNQIRDLLQQIRYSYPYHQAIGFLLEKAGADQADTEVLRDLGLQFDFYLAHAMTTKEFDSRWRLWIPKDMRAA